MNIEEELLSYKIEEIFKEKDIDEIWNSSNPSNTIFEILESYFRRLTGSIEYDSNMLWAMSEFHNNNLVFIKEKFNYPNRVISNLLNILSVLLNLKDNSEFKPKTISNNMFNQSNSQENQEVEFNSLSKEKLKEIKLGLLKYGLIQSRSSVVNDNLNEIFYMKPFEITTLLDYLNNFYFSYFKLYYHFINIERITDNKKIDVIINRPLAVPPLSQAMKQIDEKFEFEEQVEDKKEEKKKNVVIKDEKLNTEEKEKVEEKSGEPTSVEDMVQKLKLGEETRNIINQKLIELNKDVEIKINERQKKLEERLKEFEDTLKGKKK